MGGKPRRPPVDLADDLADHVAEIYRRIYQAARRIPRGKVVTYGQLAELAGYPGAARAAGAAMKLSTPEQGLPWHRVIGKRGGNMGQIAIHDPIGAAMQRAMLEAEGIDLTASGGVSLTQFGWLPVATGRRKLVT